MPFRTYFSALQRLSSIESFHLPSAKDNIVKSRTKKSKILAETETYCTIVALTATFRKIDFKTIYALPQDYDNSLFACLELVLSYTVVSACSLPQQVSPSHISSIRRILGMFLLQQVEICDDTIDQNYIEHVTLVLMSSCSRHSVMLEIVWRATGETTIPLEHGVHE